MTKSEKVLNNTYVTDYKDTIHQHLPYASAIYFLFANICRYQAALLLIISREGIHRSLAA